MTERLNALIVDDEENARKLLKMLLEETALFTEISLAASVNEAQAILDDFEPDMIFLDIRMPEKDGFSLLEDFKDNSIQPGIVFVTAHEQYALNALKQHAYDYLLKPVDRQQLNACVQSFLEYSNKNNRLSGKKMPGDSLRNLSRIRINTRNGILFINPGTVLYFKADGNYTTVCTGEKSFLCTMNIGKIEELLPAHGFIRIGRSYIINFEYLNMLDRRESTITLVRDGYSVKLKISKRHIRDLDIL
jgi:two-component system LytT family response regulator